MTSAHLPASASADILQAIVERKRAEVRERTTPLRDLELRAERSILRRRAFAKALRSARPAIVAEMKRRSPSRGELSANYQPPDLARSYEKGGAAALSVLTDHDFFGGTLHDLEAAREAVTVPALRKDFVVHPSQIVEAAAHGADAILLIAAILSDEELRRFREFAAQFLLAALVEVHDAIELRRAIDSGAALIGVNNRNLRTFEVRLQTSLDLADNIPENITRVAESGIHGPDDVRRLFDAGYHAFLVGEHLMKSGDPARAIEALRCW